MTDAETERGLVLGELGAATVGESGGKAMANRIAPVWSGAALAAPAYPVTCARGDNLAIHAAVATAPVGAVLVVDASLVPALGYFGEVLATGAQARGLAGLVIDGCVRDIGALERLSFPVFARGAALPGTTKIGGGSIGGPTWVGGVEVCAGDWIVGDVDGAVRVPSAAVDTVISAGRAREAKERSMLDALRAGSTTIDLLGLDLTPLSATDNSAGSVTGVISTAGAPAPSGGYNQARWAGDFCYLAGVGPYDPVTRAIVGDNIATQTEQALSNCAVTLAAAGLNWSNVISTSVFLADLDRDWRTFDEVYSMTLPRPYPTRAMVGAALKNILVELVMVAHAAR